ncbi:MAG: phosphotransferase family protein [Pseudomonadota bacterium]
MSETHTGLPPALLERVAEQGGGKISRLERHVARREAWIVDVERPSGEVLEGFLRIDRKPVRDAHVSLRREAQICRALRPLGMPVPALLAWYEEHHAALFSREPGRADIDALDDSPRQRRVMENFIDIIARLHQLDPDALGLDDELGEKPASPERCALDDVDRQLHQFDRFLQSYQDPLMSYGVQWLRRHAPRRVDRVCLVQGDTGPVNFLFDRDKVTAVVDWEWGHWGDPMEDLGNICVREFWNPSGGLQGLFQRYEQQSGIPYRRFDAQYYRIQQNVRGMIPIHVACQYAPRGQSLAWYLCYRYVGDRSTCEALAEAMGIEVERPDMPADVSANVLATSAVDHLRQDVLPDLATPIALSRAEDVAILIECMDRQHRYGNTLRAVECDEIARLLDQPVADYATAMEALNGAIASAALEDEVLIPYLARRAYRDEWLYWPVTRLYPERRWSELD